MSELSDMIKNWNTDILKDEDRVYDSKDDINRLIKVIPLLGAGIIQMKTSTRNLMINGLPLDGKLYKGTGSDTSGIVEVVPEGTDYVYHMAKSGTTQGAWSIKSTDTTSISQLPYVSEDILFTNTLIKGSGTATLQFLDKNGNVLSEMTTPSLTDTYQAFNVKGQLKDSIWSFRIIASDAIYFKQVMITRSSFPSDYMLSEEELEQLNIINTSGIDANTITKSQAYQVVGLKNCPANVSTSGLFITIQKDNFVQVFVPNDDTGIYYRVGVTTNRPNTKWTHLATSDNTYSKEDFTEMRTSDNINLIQDSSMSAGFWAFTKDGASTSVGSLNTADGIAHITGNGTSGASWAQYQVTNQNYQQPLIQNSEIQYDQDYTVSVETTWSDGADIGSNGEVPPSLIVREEYKDGSSKDIVHVKAVDKYGYNKWHKLSETFKFSENRKNDISFIQVILMWKGAKGDVYFRRPKLEMANLPSAYIDDTIVSVEPNHNLLQDSRDLLDGWQSNGAKVSLDTTGDMAWYQGMRVQHQFGNWSYYGTTKTPVLENGKYYTVSAYMRGLSETDINMYATILTNKSNSSNINFPLAKHLTGEWKRYSYTFKFDANTQVVNTSAIRVEGQGDWASNGGSVYVAGIKLEEGKTATDWSPSIEETIVRYETQNWQKDKITGDDGGLALRINVSGTDPMDKQFLSATGTKTFYLQGGATGNNTGDSLRGILIKDSPSFGNAYAINDKNELWFLKIQDSKLTTWSKVATTLDIDKTNKLLAEKTKNIAYVTDFGADSEGVNDSTQAFIDTVAYCRNIALASDYHRIPLVLIPSGIYKITDTIILPPYIKLVVQGFATIMADVPNNSVIHITAQSDDKPFTTGSKQQHLRSPIIKADNGGLLIKSVTYRVPGTTAIEIGSVTNLGSKFPTSRYTVSDVSVDGFDIAVQMNNFNNYIGSFNRVMLEGNNTVMRFGKTVGNVTNSGENISFYNSLFASANTGFEHLVDGFDCNFYGCSSDFIDTLFDFKRGYKKVNYFGGHIEGVKKVAQYDEQGYGLSSPVLNLYSPIVLSNFYPLFTGNLRLNADKVGWQNSKNDFKRIYLCDENVIPTEVGHNIQGYEVFLSKNLNILSDKDFKSLSGYTFSTNGMTTPETVTLAPDNELTGTALKSISTVDSGTWLEIKRKHLAVRPGETIQDGINVYMQADTFRRVTMSVEFYDIDGNSFGKTGSFTFTAGAVPNEWCAIFGISRTVPQGAFEASVTCTVSGLKTDEVVLCRDFGVMIS